MIVDNLVTCKVIQERYRDVKILFDFYEVVFETQVPMGVRISTMEIIIESEGREIYK